MIIKIVFFFLKDNSIFGILILITPFKPVDSPLPKKPPSFSLYSLKSRLNLLHIQQTWFHIRISIIKKMRKAIIINHFK